jgi:D-alanyl-D-alanine dipeptidase
MTKRLFFILLYVKANGLVAQTDQSSPIGIVNSLAVYKKQLNADATLSMKSLTKEIPNIQLDLKYATADNFTGLRMYPATIKTTFLRDDASRALAFVAAALKEKGLGIKVWDAYRPYQVTVRFWNLIHDERYVANPAKGSGHNRGIAIDLTLYNLSDGKELEMPTGFDDFSARAHHGYMQLEEKQIKNRELLRAVMEKYGFVRFETEWWHYYWPGAEKFAVLDLSFRQLNKLQ